MNTLTKNETILLRTLYDVATHEGGGITLKRRFYSPAEGLIRRGYARKVDRFPYRPYYFITDAGREAAAALAL